MKRPVLLVDLSPPPGTGRTMPRREFLRLLGLATGGLAAVAAAPAGAVTPTGSASPFPDGIKSGDPRPRRATIWTRIAAPSTDPVDVIWSVAEDAGMQQVVRGGTAQALAANGHSVTVKVQGLEPDRWYHYRFEVAGTPSVTGRLRTAPGEASSPPRLRYAFASCQQRTRSFYVAHRAIAQDGVDFLLHLGDYVYVSDGGTITLDDYRSVWRTFHSNPLLQDMHAQVPLVAVWDDGEFYNGVDRTGDPDRLAAARRAWFEAMPVPRNDEDRTYRSLRWGTLAEMFLLDTRQYRDPAIPSNSSFAGIIAAKDTLLPPCDQMFAPGRTTLGQAQRSWLKKGLAARAATWPIIASSYDMSPWKFEDRDTPELREQNPGLQRNGGLYVSNEAWDDYQWERRKLMKFIARRGIPNVLVSSAHTHFYRASEIMPDFDDPSSPVTAHEFNTGSLTADPDPRELAPEDLLRTAEQIFLGANAPYMKHVDLLNQGYAVVDVTPEEAICEFRVIDTYDANAEARTYGRFRVRAGVPGIEVLPVPS